MEKSTGHKKKFARKHSYNSPQSIVMRYIYETCTLRSHLKERFAQCVIRVLVKEQP